MAAIPRIRPVINLAPGQSPARAAGVAEGGLGLVARRSATLAAAGALFDHLVGAAEQCLYMHYNFCRIHKRLRVTAAMTAGVTGRLWTISDIVKALEDWEESR
jgi:hypothetical protein